MSDVRLIDANALIEAMYHEAFETDSDMQRWDGGCWIRYKMFENAIYNAPTIKPKQGEWIEYLFSTECSVCHTRFEYLSAYNFCPNCGAKMQTTDSIPDTDNAKYNSDCAWK